jgi:hypothetical protein
VQRLDGGSATRAVIDAAEFEVKKAELLKRI